MAAYAYSFLDTNVSITGPGGNFSLSEGGVASEGVVVAMIADKVETVYGADGTPMHSLRASKGGSVTVTLQKTSPVNAVLSQMYNLQSLSSANTGQNTITINDFQRGDSITASYCAFRKLPDIQYQELGGTMVWMFNAGYVDTILGSGTIDLGVI